MPERERIESAVERIKANVAAARAIKEELDKVKEEKRRREAQGAGGS